VVAVVVVVLAAKVDHLHEGVVANGDLPVHLESPGSVSRLLGLRGPVPPEKSRRKKVEVLEGGPQGGLARVTIAEEVHGHQVEPGLLPQGPVNVLQLPPRDVMIPLKIEIAEGGVEGEGLL